MYKIEFHHKWIIFLCIVQMNWLLCDCRYKRWWNKWYKTVNRFFNVQFFLQYEYYLLISFCFGCINERQISSGADKYSTNHCVCWILWNIEWKLFYEINLWISWNTVTFTFNTDFILQFQGSFVVYLATGVSQKYTTHEFV